MQNFNILHDTPLHFLCLSQTFLTSSYGHYKTSPNDIIVVESKATPNKTASQEFEITEQNDPDPSLWLCQFVRRIFQDQSGNEWFGTNGEATKYEPSAALRTGSESFTNYTIMEGLISCVIQSTYEDGKGRL